MKNEYELVWNDNRSGKMVSEKPKHPGQSYYVDSAVEAAAFWNANVERADSYLRDPANCSSWGMSDSRERLLVWFAKQESSKTPEQVKNPNLNQSTAAPQSETQLWEPCENCGVEPSYATTRGHLCKTCSC